MKQTISILIVICGLLLGGCGKTSKAPAVYTGPPLNDTEFAKEAFRLLAEGDEAAAAMIDWEHLNMLGIDVGAMYRGVIDKGQDSAGFIRGFITSYSNSFKSKGGRFENATNWREQSRDATNTVIATDNQAGKPMMITVTHVDGHQKISKMEL